MFTLKHLASCTIGASAFIPFLPTAIKKFHRDNLERKNLNTSEPISPLITEGGAFNKDDFNQPKNCKILNKIEGKSIISVCPDSKNHSKPIFYFYEWNNNNWIGSEINQIKLAPDNQLLVSLIDNKERVTKTNFPFQFRYLSGVNLKNSCYIQLNQERRLVCKSSDLEILIPIDN